MPTFHDSRAKPGSVAALVFPAVTKMKLLRRLQFGLIGISASPPTRPCELPVKPPNNLPCPPQANCRRKKNAYRSLTASVAWPGADRMLPGTNVGRFIVRFVESFTPAVNQKPMSLQPPHSQLS